MTITQYLENYDNQINAITGTTDEPLFQFLCTILPSKYTALGALKPLKEAIDKSAEQWLKEYKGGNMGVKKVEDGEKALP